MMWMNLFNGPSGRWRMRTKWCDNSLEQLHSEEKTRMTCGFASKSLELAIWFGINIQKNILLDHPNGRRIIQVLILLFAKLSL